MNNHINNEFVRIENERLEGGRLLRTVTDDSYKKSFDFLRSIVLNEEKPELMKDIKDASLKFKIEKYFNDFRDKISSIADEYLKGDIEDFSESTGSLINIYNDIINYINIVLDFKKLNYNEKNIITNNFEDILPLLKELVDVSKELGYSDSELVEKMYNNIFSRNYTPIKYTNYIEKIQKKRPDYKKFEDFNNRIKDILNNEIIEDNIKSEIEDNIEKYEKLRKKFLVEKNEKNKKALDIKLNKIMDDIDFLIGEATKLIIDDGDDDEDLDINISEEWIKTIPPIFYDRFSELYEIIDNPKYNKNGSLSKTYEKLKKQSIKSLNKLYKNVEEYKRREDGEAAIGEVDVEEDDILKSLREDVMSSSDRFKLLGDLEALKIQIDSYKSDEKLTDEEKLEKEKYIEAYNYLEAANIKNLLDLNVSDLEKIERDRSMINDQIMKLQSLKKLSGVQTKKLGDLATQSKELSQMAIDSNKRISYLQSLKPTRFDPISRDGKGRKRKVLKKGGMLKKKVKK